MDLGAFSIGLAVKDIEASRQFYETLGFSIFFRDQAKNWLVMKNGTLVICLFQGVIEKNVFIFNPGWDNNARPLEKYTDVRELQRQLKARGITMISEADETSTGPARFTIADPDGNAIMLDQHV